MPVLDTTGGIYAVAVPAIVDKRDKGKQVGENNEGKDIVPVYSCRMFRASSGTISRHASDHRVGCHRGRPRRQGAQIELVEFWVSEESAITGPSD